MDKNKLVLELYIKEDGTILVQSVFKTKELVVNILADALKITAMAPNNVKEIKPGFLKKKTKGAFGGHS